MKRALLAFVATLGMFVPAAAQTWYYNVDQDTQITPATLDFDPTSQDLLCAALLEPGATPAGGVSVENLTLPAGCPSAPPVVVWGVDPDTGDTVYAALITVKFWGQKRSSNSRYGVDALVRVLKNNYALHVDASGDLDEADAQFLPPLTTPPVSGPVGGSGWYAWRSAQSLSIADPEVSDVQNHYWWNRTCRRLYNDNCWSAVFTWALPVRLVVHGGEKGSYQVTITPGLFEERSASTLSVSGGELTRPAVIPAPR
ncbi:hypothetical protein [Oceanithermus sp.]